MKRFPILWFGMALLLVSSALASDSLHTTYLWHLHQPIYWPDQDRNGGAQDRYESAWPSIQQTDGGQSHPENNLREIFGKDDRIAAYQSRTRDSIQTISGHADGGAQINYSGALMENIGSLGAAGQLGYGGGWANGINEAHGWTTSGGHSRADIVNFSYHHAMLPLLSERTQWLQIRLHQEMMNRVWGITPGSAKGFFPTETCFSRRLIPVLEDLGVEWSFVSNEHLSRACDDFPVAYGSGGINCDPPNRADQINGTKTNYWSDQIDRGCSPTNAYPFAYTPHRAQYIDPHADPASLQAGDVSEIVVVPTAQAISWDDGYGSIGANALDGIASGNDPSRPMLVVLAHDGDNAWGGGYSYYMEAVQNFTNDCASRGYSPSTVNQYLADHPVPANDIVHVEDGGWVNADSDFGSPIYINWLYPLIQENGDIDPANGWHYKAREYAIFTAAENRIRTAENLAGGPGTTDIADVLDSDGGSSAIERAWAYYMASMDSGNVYYGNPLDMEVKGTVGCNEAMEHIDPILAGMSPSQDLTEPTVMVPQRHPYNPGSVSFGAQYGYQQFINDGSFEVWTFASDVSGIQSATLKYRIDVDGVNPLDSWQNETYIGGAEVGAWQSVAMTQRTFPKDNPYSWGGLEGYGFELPTHIADHFHASVPAHNEKLIDYYVEVVDMQGNVATTDIQHVWIGDGSGQTGGNDGRVTTIPAPPVRGQQALIQYDPVGGPIEGAGAVNLHYGFNNWDAPTINDVAMAWNAGESRWEVTIPIAGNATAFDCVFNNGSGTWDSNGGSDWHIATSAALTPLTANFNASTTSGSAPLSVTFTDTSTGSPTGWSWDFDDSGSEDSTQQNPTHIYSSPGTYSVSLTVTNASGEDTETKANLIFVSAAPPTPELTLNRSSIAAQAAEGNSPGDETFTVTNTGGGTLNYGVSISYPGAGSISHVDVIAYLLGQINDDTGLDLNGDSKIDIGDVVHAIENPAIDWLSVSPNSGSSTGESDTIGVLFSTASLPIGTHTAQITVTGNADNSPQTIDVTLTINEDIMVPNETTIDPNPPTAGQQVRVWYVATGGPIAAATQVTLHWGVNGGLTSGGSWESVQDTAMTESFVDGTWSADITLPANATTLNFVTNNGAGTWDSNGGNDWNFAVNSAPQDPLLEVSPPSITVQVTEGNNPPNSAITVRNAGGATLNYTVTPTGIPWMTPSVSNGSSTGETDSIDVQFASSSVPSGFYEGSLTVTGNAANSPQVVDVTVTVLDDNAPSAITIGPGPELGTTAGTTWYEQFQDWTAEDVFALDEANDTYAFGDGNDRSRDIIAFYARDDAAGGNTYFRVDFFDLALAAEEGSMDLYVAIDFNTPGTGQLWFPDFTDCQTDTLWDVCIALYQSDAWTIYDDDFTILSNSSTNPGLFLGANYRSDLDSVEFGVARSVLINAGWDGMTDANFQVFTTRDFTDGGAGEIPDKSDITDAIVDDDRGFSDDVLNGAIPTSPSIAPVPFAYIIHGNQSLAPATGIQDLINSDSILTPASDFNAGGHPTGYHRALDTAEIFGVPPTVHVSATLAAGLQWADRPGTSDPQDGPEFNQRLLEMFALNHADLMSGVLSEHMMPYFEGEVNAGSISVNESALHDYYGVEIDPATAAFWVPERVIRGTTFADIAGEGYQHTVLDQNEHIREWFGQSEADNNGHRLHRINGVNVFLLNNETDGRKFFPQDGGLNIELREALLNLALDNDDEQLMLAFDDWEAYAGRSFTSFKGNPNPDQWNLTARWLANHPWIDCTTLGDIAGRGWTPIDHGTDTGLGLHTYDWLLHATRGSYDNWYYGTPGGEEDFSDIQPPIRADLAQSGNKVIGAIDEGGSIYSDLLADLIALTDSDLTELAILGFLGAIYETAWHDEDEPLESGNPDVTFDGVADWALKLNGLVARRVGVAVAAAEWHTSSPTQFTAISAEDFDHDGEVEYAISNNQVLAFFENDGGRMIAAYVRDPGTGDAYQVVGCPIANPDYSDEREGENNAGAIRTSGIKDWWAAGPNTSMYVNDIYTVSLALSGYLTFESSDGKVARSVGLNGNHLEIEYSVDNSIDDLYIRCGLSPNVLDLLGDGQEFLTVTDTGTAVEVSNSGGARTVTTSVVYGGGLNTGATINGTASDGTANSPRDHVLTHMVELSGSDTFTFSLAFEIE